MRVREIECQSDCKVWVGGCKCVRERDLECACVILGFKISSLVMDLGFRVAAAEQGLGFMLWSLVRVKVSYHARNCEK